MNDPSRPFIDSKRLCVPFQEAVWWIAFRNLAGWSMGPQPVCNYRGRDQFQEWADGRIDFALELLLDFGARGKIIIYDGFNALSTAFLARARYDEEDGEPSLVVIDDEDDEDGVHEGRSFSGLAVDFADLSSHFYGEDRPAGPSVSSDSPVPASALATVASQQQRRRSPTGRPPKYMWDEFATEAIRRCIAAAAEVRAGRASPITNKASLAKEMAEWCGLTWGEEPALSLIRSHADPIFSGFAAAFATPNTAEKSAPDLSA